MTIHAAHMTSHACTVQQLNVLNLYYTAVKIHNIFSNYEGEGNPRAPPLYETLTTRTVTQPVCTSRLSLLIGILDLSSLQYIAIKINN